jgi:iron complex outermembrane receptor protein
MSKSLFQYWLIVLGLSLCMVNTVQGQRIVRNERNDKTTALKIPPVNSLPLKEVIEALEKKFRVSILYREQLVQNKNAVPDTLTGNNPDNALRTLLTPFGLTFKKVSPTQIIIS